MLIIQLKEGEGVKIGDSKIKILRSRGRVRLGFECSRDLKIERLVSECRDDEDEERRRIRVHRANIERPRKVPGGYGR